MQSTHEPLVSACIRGDLAKVKQLLVEGADIEGVWRSCTGLMWAAAEGHLSIVELLLSVGANVNARNEVRYTAVLYAAEADQRDIVLALLDHSAQTDASICKSLPGDYFATDGSPGPCRYRGATSSKGRQPSP